MRITKVLNIEVNNKEADIYIIGVIGYDSHWQHEDSEDIATSKEDMRKELKALSKIENVNKITLHVDSPGGSVNHALSMFHALKTNKAEIHGIYEGNSASAATVIMAAAKKENITIPSYLGILVHETRMFVFDNLTAKNLEVIASDLHKTNKTLADIYANQTGNSTADNLVIMSENNGEGRLMSANEAKEAGFVGNVIELNQDIAAIDYSLYKEWSDKQVSKLKKINNMGLFNSVKKQVLKVIKVGDKSLTFRDLKEGSEVETVGSEDAFTGNFEFENQSIEVVEDKVTAVTEITGQSKEVAEINEKLDALITSFADFKTEVVTSFAEVAEAVENNEKALINAKITKSKPKLPTQEFVQKTDIKVLSVRDRVKAKRKADAILKQKGREI